MFTESKLESSHPYGPNEKMIETIHPDCKEIKIDFEYQTEYGYDYLYIGSNRYSGNGTDSITLETPVIIRFSSDGSSLGCHISTAYSKGVGLYV